LERPWLKLCFTVPALTAPARGFRVNGVRPPGRFSLSFASLIRSLYIPAALREGGGSPEQSMCEKGRRRPQIAPPFSRLLAPTLRKERAEARKPLDVCRPAVGTSPRKEDEVYHIIQP